MNKTRRPTKESDRAPQMGKPPRCQPMSRGKRRRRQRRPAKGEEREEKQKKRIKQSRLTLDTAKKRKEAPSVCLVIPTATIGRDGRRESAGKARQEEGELKQKRVVLLLLCSHTTDIHTHTHIQRTHAHTHTHTHTHAHAHTYTSPRSAFPYEEEMPTSGTFCCCSLAILKCSRRPSVAAVIPSFPLHRRVFRSA